VLSNLLRNQIKDRNTLGFPCPKCGREYGRLKITKEMRKRRNRISSNEWQHPASKEIVVGYDTNNNPIKKELTIKRNIHPFKYVSVLTHYGKNVSFGKNIPVIVPTNPSINPKTRHYQSKPTTDATNKLIKSVDRHFRTLSLRAKMIDKLRGKYPYSEDINAFCNELLSHIEFIYNYWKSGIDNRYKRSLPEWNEIVKYANETSAYKARKKYYGVKPGGEKDYLSIREINKKKNEIQEQDLDLDQQLAQHRLACTLGFFQLDEIIRQDLELFKECKKMKQEYYMKDDSGNDNNNDLNQKNSSSMRYAYTYFKIIHYDHGRRIECRIKESQIPLDIRQKITN
jgi:hypothetical protein